MLWELDTAVEGCAFDAATATLYLFTGNDLLASPGGTQASAQAPALAHSFPAAPRAVCEAALSAGAASTDATRLLVAMTSGVLWQRDGDVWSQATASNAGALGAVAAWEGHGDELRGVAGGAGAHLLEELDGAGLWANSRDLDGDKDEWVSIPCWFY